MDELVERLGSHFQALEGEGEVADGLVVEAVGAGAVVADVVGAPAGAELLPVGGQFLIPPRGKEIVEAPR